MVNTMELKACMVRAGYTQKDLAKEVGMSAKTFYSKMKSGKFGLDEANRIALILNISDPGTIFFARK